MRNSSWLRIALNTQQQKYLGNPKDENVGPDPRYGAQVVSRIVEILPKHRPNCDNDAIGHTLDEEFGGGVAELASDKRVDDDYLLSWSCCQSLKS